MNFLILIAFFSTASAIILDCDFKIISNYKNLPPSYFADCASYTDKQNKILTDFNGNHEENQTNYDVKGITLSLYAKNLDYIPKGFEKFFPNLIAMNVYRGKFIELNGDEFDSYKNLEWLAVHRSQLEVVPGNLFTNNKNLKTIYFSSNKIRKVGSGLLDGLKDLSYITFSGNVCINEIAEGFDNIENLKKSLREKCEDVLTTEAPETTTTPTEWTTTEKITTCEDLSEIIKNLDAKNEKVMNLRFEKLNENLNIKIEKLNEEQSKKIKEQTKDLKAQNHEMTLKINEQNIKLENLEKLNVEENEKLTKMAEEIETIKAMLRDILEGLKPQTSEN